MSTVSEPDPGAGRAGVGADRAMDARETLSLAEGILIALRRCGHTEAFEELLDVARRHHLSVLNVARALVESAIGARPPLASERYANATTQVAEWEARPASRLHLHPDPSGFG
ncbi:ANTAR domain-containing protein [Rhodococcus sp. NPDC127530]|uniref:ANTAR domain-containing protein n=1 Tax=unclassified Rhodococcus (in: high G+C Gram-positive bacteria) TaxID=192944 RepID=UPI0036386157